MYIIMLPPYILQFLTRLHLDLRRLFEGEDNLSIISLVESKDE